MQGITFPCVSMVLRTMTLLSSTIADVSSNGVISSLLKRQSISYEQLPSYLSLVSSGLEAQELLCKGSSSRELAWMQGSENKFGLQ